MNQIFSYFLDLFSFKRMGRPTPCLCEFCMRQSSGGLTTSKYVLHIISMLPARTTNSKNENSFVAKGSPFNNGRQSAHIYLFIIIVTWKCLCPVAGCYIYISSIYFADTQCSRRYISPLFRNMVCKENALNRSLLFQIFHPIRYGKYTKQRKNALRVYDMLALLYAHVLLR